MTDTEDDDRDDGSQKLDWYDEIVAEILQHGLMNYGFGFTLKSEVLHADDPNLKAKLKSLIGAEGEEVALKSIQRVDRIGDNTAVVWYYEE